MLMHINLVNDWVKGRHCGPTNISSSVVNLGELRGFSISRNTFFFSEDIRLIEMGLFPTYIFFQLIK